MFNQIDNVPWQITLIYGLPTYHQRKIFWESLDEIGNSFKGSWLAIGDFNVVLTSVDKLG